MDVTLVHVERSEGGVLCHVARVVRGLTLDFADNLSLTSSFVSPETVFVSENRTPDRLFSRLRPAVPRPLPDLPDKMKKEKPEYPRWSDLSGTDLGNLFGENQKFRSYLRRKTPEEATILRIDRKARALRLCLAPPLATTLASDSRMRQATKISRKLATALKRS